MRTSVLAGKTYTAQQAMDLLQARIDASIAVNTTKATYQNAVQAADTETANSKQFVAGIRAAVYVMFSSQVDVLGDFGLVPHKSRTEPTAPPSAPVPPRPPVTAPSAPRNDERPDIALLRRNALDACKETRWEPCLAGLDLARRYDPAGESDPLVTLARQQATLALEGRDAARNENAKEPPRDPAPGR